MDKYRHKYNVILDNMDMSEYRLRPISAIMYLQDAFARLCATRRVAAYDLFPKNLYWVVSEFNIEFPDKMPFWSEDIDAEIWISELTKLKIYVDFRFYYKDNIFAQGNSCWYVLSQETRRPVKTDFLSDVLDVCNDFVMGEHKKFNLSETGDKISEVQHKNNLSDIDFNSHVNNKSYINIADASVDKNFKKTHKLKTLNIKFLRESFLDDLLICSTYKTDSENMFVHKITKDDEPVCEIQSAWENKTISKETILEYDMDVKNEKQSVF